MLPGGSLAYPSKAEPSAALRWTPPQSYRSTLTPKALALPGFAAETP